LGRGLPGKDDMRGEERRTPPEWLVTRRMCTLEAWGVAPQGASRTRRVVSCG
jgi:hypothetical protein